MTGQSPFAGSGDERGRGARPASAVPPMQAPYLRTALLPSAVIATVCVLAAMVALFGHASVHTVREVLAAVAAGAVAMLAVTVVAARAASRQLDARVRAARLVVRRGQAELQQMVDKLIRGEQSAPPVPVPAVAAEGDPFKRLTNELEQSQYDARQSVLLLADKGPGARPDQRVEIFVNLARRMQSLVHRGIEVLDELEAKVEDPDLLKGLFMVDHLATRMRRQSESLAVLGGSVSRRQWTRQVTMHEVLRAAVAEVEQYSRVKVVPPVEGVLAGAAVTDVIHLIAELVENATKFSAPHTTALLRAQHVSAGLAIEIEDRGLGIILADQNRMNNLLADPSRMDIDELLRDGRIGLYVVAALARRHGIRVQLQNNIFGGTQAVVVLPRQLLELADTDRSLPSNEPGVEQALAPWFAPVPMAGAKAPATVPPVPPVPRVPAVPAVAATVPAGGRPPLPRRQQQPASPAHSPDSRRDEPGDAAPARGTGTRTGPPAAQLTGLMADFLKGVSRAEGEGPPEEGPPEHD